MRASKELPIETRLASELRASRDSRSTDVSQRPDSAGVYNEEAFRYFLEIERRRSRASGQSFLLLVIDLDEPGDVIPPRVATKVFAALSGSLRDTDFVGWYSEACAIGAVLIQAVDLSKVDAVSRVRSRVSKSLASHVPAALAGRLQIRLCQVRSDREVWS